MLPGIARQRLLELRSHSPSDRSSIPGLLDYVEKTAPDLDRPTWLSPYAAKLQCAIGGNLRIAFAAPPQHGKTVLTLCAFLYWARYFPGKRHAYVTYNQTQSGDVAKLFQRRAAEAGFIVDGTLDIVDLGGGTRVKFTSIGGALTGYPIDGVCVIDDPIADAADARSAAVRRDCIDFWKSVARTRRHPGASFFEMATRWHVEDLTGYLIKNESFEYINLKAIAEPANVDDIDDEGRVLSDPLRRMVGESLCPVLHGQPFKTPEFFAEERTDPYTWAAMFQGEPVPAGATVFHEPGSLDEKGHPSGPGYYAVLPTTDYRGAFGIDLAYTAKTSADWSICIEGIAHGGKLYIIDVQRKQVEGPAFALTLKAKTVQRKGWPLRWYCSGTEKVAAQFLIRQGIPVKPVPVSADKLVRSRDTAAAWNRGDILLPESEADIPIPGTERLVDTKWLTAFLSVVLGFTGVNDSHDDDVDALAALYDQLMRRNPMLAALQKRIDGPP